MDDSERSEATPPIVVGEVTGGPSPFRQVRIKGVPVGRAHGPADVIEFARRAGLSDLDLDDPGLVAWRGGGPDDWQT